MPLIEKTVALVIATVCLVLLVRLLLGSARRQRMERWARTTFIRLRTRIRRLVRWRSSRKAAAKAAEAAIEKARRAGTWEGNVYTPKSFEKPSKRD